MMEVDVIEEGQYYNEDVDWFHGREREARLHNIHDMLPRKSPVFARPKEMNGPIYQISLKP